MTELLNDILKQPQGLIGALRSLLEKERSPLRQATAALSQAKSVYLTGIGASWHAVMAAASFFHAAGRPVLSIEASELLRFTRLAPDSAVVIVSRSGRSVEIVNLLGKARSAGAKIVAITNTPDSPLALECDVAVCVDLPFDHAVSVTMYTGLAMAAGLVASAAVGKMDSSLGPSLTESLLSVEKNFDPWREKIEAGDWISSSPSVYFLARGASLASCHEARLLWEEAAKAPATAMSTGGFRHGPQEIVYPGLRFCLWLDQHLLRTEDLEVAEDLRRLGAAVMLIGEGLSDDAGDFVFSLPGSPRGWQFLIDIIPAQIAAERLSRLRGVDCDSLRFCPYIVENEGGIISHMQYEI
ncbi:MAG TPA: SIS domain-containing protein [Blastocatellia bacterium]|nr:SIS domain-containing protein [Blastocatellia bacterium]